ncbi:MAG: molybdopterin-dependent oxidoreductase [Gammaproteobacteria bacterium]|nr:molybdopterin-dependent oxidoreductase [Gammaproteobacteria bacterium]
MTSNTKRHPTQISARAMAAANGLLLGFEFYGEYNTGAYASWGPTVAGRVDVDTRLGAVAVKRFVAAHDVGKALW